MASVADFTSPTTWITVAELWERLGRVPLERIRLAPPPGAATEQDVLRSIDHADRICELVDGVLVEKTVGYMESLLALAIGEYLRTYVREHHLGVVLGADGALRILPGQVRVPDVCFLRWERFPGGRLPESPIPIAAPDLAVEVLSEGNTESEMQRKLHDYFAAGTVLVWYVDLRTRTVAVFTSADRCTVLHETDTLTGGGILPGFALPLVNLFAELQGK